MRNNDVIDLPQSASMDAILDAALAGNTVRVRLPTEGHARWYKTYFHAYRDCKRRQGIDTYYGLTSYVSGGDFIVTPNASPDSAANLHGGENVPGHA